MEKKIIVICGPTGVGKTGFAIALSTVFKGEIVGADSMQIYQYLDIGTAKPDQEEQRQAPHHLIDFVDPAHDFDAVKYVALADRAIGDIVQRGKLPIVAGGTGFYIKALLHGLFKGRTADEKIIARLEAEAIRRGSLALHERLAATDPVASARIHPNDRFRVVRALEVLESTGKPISHFHETHQFAPQRYNALKLGLTMDRERLYDRINRRVDLMLDMGLVKEVMHLREKGYSCDLKSMQSIGYRHVCDYLNGVTSHEEMVTLLKRDTRRYAKRQFTWFRKDKEMIWVEPSDLKKAGELVAQFMA
ncbi:tRNA dimethylallyltransferase [Desulfocicer vacuolatum DSM 3385]|uniref:tRNA dimethylallyltransferase n=1 Tax=Desulfocicer vacuolatum DSM 3385 TaxID=1121400 RepID=A0A1W1ZMK6_9BACT|nr:tRNA (adenosine(37)-N6)-dimethylallyltransferase MiaA [Desulfocicer vacuolatum]SMC49597.1 tRNA dimethylallyltransferase [Desulfocicer vacuolatum DSM 3385]